MKKRVNRLIAALFATVVAVSPLVGCGTENTDSGILELNVFNAEEYISEFDADWETTDIIEDFEAYATEKYGRKVKVNYSTFGTLENMYNELQLTKKKSKNGYTYAYDLVCPSDYMIQRMINEDMLETYDVNYDEDGNVSYKTIDNFNDYASGFIKDLFNSKEEADYVTGTVKKWSEYAVCYMWGTMGFIYNPVKLAETNANIDVNTIVDEKGELKLSGEELENAVNANTWHLPWEAYYKNLGTIKDSIRDTYALAVGNVYSKELLALRALWENGTLTQSEYQSVLIKVFNNVNTVFSDEFAELKLPADKLAAVQKIFRKMYDKGDIYKGTYKGKYCTHCECLTFTVSRLTAAKRIWLRAKSQLTSPGRETRLTRSTPPTNIRTEQSFITPFRRKEAISGSTHGLCRKAQTKSLRRTS